MPLSPRPPSGGGRPWSSTAIPPAYRRKRIANCERSIPLLTTRGYPLVLGDKIPMRPSSCVPGQHSTPVLAPARPASSASVPMKAAIKENSFKELVKYWEQTTLEKAKTPSSLKPSVKGDRLGNDEDATMCNKTAADVDTADAFPEADVPHKPGNLPIFGEAISRNKTAADVNTADAFPEGDMPHTPDQLPLFNEAILCNKAAADVDTPEALFDETILRNKTAADVNTAEALFDETILRNKTATDVDTAEALFDETILRNKTATDVDTAEAVFDETILRNKTATDVDTAEALFDETILRNKTATDVDTAEALFDETISHNKTATDVDTAEALFDETILRNKTATDVDTAEALFNETILRNKTATDVDTADAFPEGDMPHTPDQLPLFNEAILCNKAAADMETAEALFNETILRNKTATDVDTADAFPEGDMPHTPDKLPLFNEAILCNKAAADMETAEALINETILRNKAAADVDKADAFPEGDMPHTPDKLPLFNEAILCNKAAADVDTPEALFDETILRNKTTADVETSEAFSEADVPHKPGNLLQPDIHAGSIRKPLTTIPDRFGVADIHHEAEGFPCLNAEMLQKEFLHTRADQISFNLNDTHVARHLEIGKKYLNDLTTPGIGCTLPENIEIDCRRARTLQQHLASVKQKVATNTTDDEWRRFNELQSKMNIIDNILKEINEKAKFVNKEMVEIESESFLIISKMETPRCMNRKEKEPPSDFQTLVKLPPIQTKAKPTGEIPSKKHLSGQSNMYNNPPSQIVKSSSLPRQMKTKQLPAIVTQKGKLNPVVSTARVSTQRRPQTDINNEYKQLQRALDRVGRNLGPTPLQDISYHEPEPGKPMRRPRNEQDNVPCRGKSKETKSETGFTEKPNQRKRNRNRQKKKKIEKAPVRIEDRPPFSADIKPSKYFSDISRLSDAS